jgi:hypothetical protein
MQVDFNLVVEGGRINLYTIPTVIRKVFLEFISSTTGIATRVPCGLNGNLWAETTM